MLRESDERLAAWRQLLQAAKPSEGRWQPPSPFLHVLPQEPPPPLRDCLEGAVATLPPTERAVTFLRFANGLTPDELAVLLDTTPLLIAVIEQGAIERLADALQVEPAAAAAFLAWWGTQQTPPAATPLRSPTCPFLNRLYEALLRWDWTDEERRHVADCPSCHAALAKARSTLWHPSVDLLWRHVTDSPLTEEDRQDIAFHLQTDRCRRCTLLVTWVLRPLAQLWGAVPTAVAITPHPVALSATGFASYQPRHTAPVADAYHLREAKSAIAAVQVQEGNFTARLQWRADGWVASAEARGVPAETVVRFLWVAADGCRQVQRDAPLVPAYGDWCVAETVLATDKDDLGEGFFVAFLLPSKAER